MAFLELDATTNESLRKIFVGRLSGDTSSDSLKGYFSQFGEIKEGVVVTDKDGNSKKFGFITYVDMESADKCISNKTHTVDNKPVDVKRAIPKDCMTGVTNTKKLFLGGLPKNDSISEDQIKELFNNCELNVKVSSVILVKNKDTNEPKGFGFVTFEDEDHVAKVAIVHYFNINGKKVEAKGAQPREQDAQQGGRQGMGRPGMGRGYGYDDGGYNGYNRYNDGYAYGGGQDYGYNNYGGGNYGGGSYAGGNGNYGGGGYGGRAGGRGGGRFNPY